MSLSKSERKLRAALGGQATAARHNPKDPNGYTAAGRRAFLTTFEEAADPTGELPERERQRRAELLRRQHFTRLSLKAATARRKRREAQEKRQRKEQPHG